MFGEQKPGLQSWAHGLASIRKKYFRRGLAPPVPVGQQPHSGHLALQAGRAHLHSLQHPGALGGNHIHHVAPACLWSGACSCPHMRETYAGQRGTGQSDSSTVWCRAEGKASVFACKSGISSPVLLSADPPPAEAKGGFQFNMLSSEPGISPKHGQGTSQREGRGHSPSLRAADRSVLRDSRVDSKAQLPSSLRAWPRSTGLHGPSW